MIIVGYKEASANFDTVASAAGTPRTPAARSATARRKRSKASALSGGSLKSFAHLKRGEAWGFADRCGGSRWSMFKPERRPPPPGQYVSLSLSCGCCFCCSSCYCSYHHHHYYVLSPCYSSYHHHHSLTSPL